MRERFENWLMLKTYKPRWITGNRIQRAAYKWNDGLQAKLLRRIMSALADAEDKGAAR